MQSASKAGVPRRAIIAGGSIAGLFAALLLLRRGWNVQVCERVATELSGRGAGIVTHEQLRRILQAVGADPETPLGIPVQRRVMLDRAGRTVGTLEYPQIMTSWDRLFRLLREALPPGCYAGGRDLQAVTQDEAGVTATFGDGQVLTADLLIGADGLRSTVREQIVGEMRPLYAGYTAWRGLVGEAEIPEPARAAIIDEFAFCLAPGEQMLGYPVAGENDDMRPGHRRYNFVWYRPADEAHELPRLLTDEAGRRHDLSIPPPLIAPAIIAEMRAASRQILAPQFADMVAATRQPFLQPVYDLESPRMACGRVALIGDAAFVVRPHVAAGVTKAAEDAVALADALATEPTVQDALRRFEQERLPAGRRVVQRARHLGAYLQAELRTEEERQAAGRHQNAEAVMAETAVLDF